MEVFVVACIAKVEEIMSIAGYDDPVKAQKLIDEAATLVKKYKDDGVAVPHSPQAALMKESMMMGSAKAKADQLLKSELSKLQAKE